MAMVEVAKLAGVSQATVSRVVNRHPSVSPEVERQVRQAMQELNYRPRRRRNQEANGIFPNISGVIAVLLLDDSFSRHPEMALAKLRGVERAISAAGMTMVVSHVGPDQPVPPVLERDDLAGVLLWGYADLPELRACLDDMPCLWLSSHAEGEGVQVLEGNEEVGRIAAQYLIENTCKKLAFVNVAASSPAYRARIDGFRFEAHLNNVPTIDLVQQCNEAEPPDPMAGNGMESTMARVAEFIVATPGVCDGLFLPDDRMTAFLYAHLAQLGFDPKKDHIRIVSVGNETALLAGLYPRPATIDLAPEMTGRCAVEQLIWQMQHPGDRDGVKVVVTPKLIVGDQ